MQRRDLLGALGAATATALAGCRGYLEEDGPSGSPWVTTDVPGPITRRSIGFHEPRRRRAVRRVRVAWDEAARAVHVTGAMRWGCDRPGFDETRYDPDEDRLSVRLGPVEQAADRGCGFSKGGRHYRATVRFEDSLPATVRVESRETVTGRRGEAGTVERTVERAAQRDLCTSDHPEGSDAAERAHWTCPETYVRAEDSHAHRGTPSATPEGPPDD